MNPEPKDANPRVTPVDKAGFTALQKQVEALAQDVARLKEAKP
jgi:hypothetical protein